MKEYNLKIKELLDNADELRKQIIADNIDYITLGQMPKKVTDYINMSTQIQAIIVTNLMQQGLTLHQVPERPAFVRFEFEGKSYTLFKNSLTTPNNKIVTRDTNPQTEPFTNKNESSFIEESTESELSSELDTKKTEETEEDVSEDFNETEAYIQEDEYNFQSEDEEDYIEETNEEEIINNDEEEIVYDEEEIIYDEEEIIYDDEEEVINEEETIKFVESDEKAIPKPISNGAIVIGEETDKDISNFPAIEKRTLIDDLVYERLTISLKHKTTYEQPEIIEIMCAPLKLYKFSSLSVPIIVSVDSKKTKIVKSSLDTLSQGKNIISLSINDFSILCRGTFDESGCYHTIITTTDVSANKGDVLEVISIESYGITRSQETKNGHPVLHYTSEEGNSYVCVFPLGKPNEDKFIVCSKTEEFIDYMYSSSDIHGAYKARIYENQVAKNVEPRWDENYLELNIVEVF